MALVVGGAFAAAIGMHFGSLTVVAVGVTLLIAGGAAAALRSWRSTRSTGTET